MRPTQRAPDWWARAAKIGLHLASSWFRQSGVVSSHPPAGNANRWAAERARKKLCGSLEQPPGVPVIATEKEHLDYEKTIREQFIAITSLFKYAREGNRRID